MSSVQRRVILELLGLGAWGRLSKIRARAWLKTVLGFGNPVSGPVFLLKAGPQPSLNRRRGAQHFSQAWDPRCPPGFHTPIFFFYFTLGNGDLKDAFLLGHSKGPLSPRAPTPNRKLLSGKVELPSQRQGASDPGAGQAGLRYLTCRYPYQQELTGG